MIYPTQTRLDIYMNFLDSGWAFFLSILDFVGVVAM